MPGSIPVNTEGDMWDVGTLVYSGDLAGAANYLGGKGFDVPNASVNFAQGTSNFYLAGVGYELGMQEINRAARMGTNLGEKKAMAARKIAEKFIYDRVISGSTVKNFTGLINNASVPTANATTGTWGSATVANILADVNQALNDVFTNSGETATANALLLPTTKFLQLNNTQLTNASESLLTFVQREQQLYRDHRSAARHPPEPRTGDRRRVLDRAHDRVREEPGEHGVFPAGPVRVPAAVPDLDR
jgi:hypothetical protein